MLCRVSLAPPLAVLSRRSKTLAAAVHCGGDVGALGGFGGDFTCDQQHYRPVIIWGIYVGQLCIFESRLHWRHKKIVEMVDLEY